MTHSPNGHAHRPDEIRILGKDVEKHLPAFFSLLLGSARETLLPDILEVVGHERLLKFLDIFAGMSITVPSRDVLIQFVRDADIYVRFRPDTAPALAKEHGLEVEQVREIYRRSKAVIDAVGITPR